jgi:tripartite-type tricarboxylate transporter receptor subunit TctC
MTIRTHRRTLTLGLAALAAAPAAVAQEWPSRPVTLVIPAAPGGATDIVGRVMAEELAKRLGQTVVVDNRTGASGMIGTQAVARAAPDGHTLLLAYSTPIFYVQHMFPKVAYDVRRDFEMITQVAATSLVLTVHESVPARNMKEFMAWARAGKGRLNYGSYGTGSAGHLMSAYLSQSRDLGMAHVPYKSEGPYIQDLAAGTVPWGMGTLGPALPHLKSGKVRILAVLGPRRLPELPDVPTMAEAGFPDPEFNTVAWFTLLAPAGTPQPIVRRLEKEAMAIIQSTPMKARFQVFGLEAVKGGSEQFRRDFEASSPIIEKLVRISGAKME